jgi:acid phosphatase
VIRELIDKLELIERRYRGKHRHEEPIRSVVVAWAVTFVLVAFAWMVLPSPNAQAADYTTPMTAVFFYDQTFRHSTDHYQPALSPYSDINPTHVAAEVAGIKHAGMQAAIASWWGQGQHHENVAFPILYSVAAAQHLGVIPYYEPEGQGDPSIGQIQADLTYLKAYADNNPQAAVRIGGKPVIFVYNAGTTGCAEVTKWKTATAGNWYFNMKVFPGFATCSDQPSSWHQYGPAVAESVHLPYSFNISPGFWKYDEATPRLVRDPARWATNVAHLKASNAAWKLVTSWNEWGEGTSVEPSPSWQSGSGWGTYVDELHRQLVEWVTPSPSPSTSTSSSPTPTSSPTPSPSTSTSSSPSPTPSSTSSTPSPSTSTSSSPTPTPSSTSVNLPRPDHIVIAIFENHSDTQIINSNVPWFKATMTQSAVFSNAAATRHPSLPNYLAMFSGSTQGVADDGCDYVFSGPNLARQLLDSGQTWATYSEGLPSIGYTGCSSSGYAKKHNPGAYFTNVPTATSLPFSMFPTDYTALPKVSFVVPNQCNSMHDCSIATGDTWAANHLESYRQWALTHNSMLWVIFDEDGGDANNQIINMVSGAHVHVGVYPETMSQYRTLRTWEALCGLPGVANAASLTEVTDTWS